LDRLLACAAAAALLCACPGPAPTTPCDGLEVDLYGAAGSSYSSARAMDELALHLVRKDLPRPTVHARNLFHLSAAMYDAWAAYDASAAGVFSSAKATGTSSDQAKAVAYAGARVLLQRYAKGAGGAQPLACVTEWMSRNGLGTGSSSTSGSGPEAVGNRAAQAVLDAGSGDGANEANDYADTTGFVALNDPLVPSARGDAMAAPDHWQPLALSSSVSQNGIAVDGLQKYVGAQWGLVAPFALVRPSAGAPYHDPGPPPAAASSPMHDRYLAEVLTKQAQLSTSATSTLDISPGAYGNNTLGANDGRGRAQNPLTGQPYAAQVVPLADFGRVLAEFWADGPRSETPPGHWNVLANGVSDSAQFERRLGGSGPVLAPLEWDVKLYLALNGALHDAAIACWEVKRLYTTARPISLVRWTNDNAGLPLLAGVTEPHPVQVFAFSWGTDGAGVTWRDPGYWVPYQRATFVTPAFPGYVSGHSTFSRAAAEVLTDFTGTPFFPGGLGEFVAPMGTFLQFESGPSVTVRLQWATYQDAADQAGQSRIWGGIHIEPDDLQGRRIGHAVGLGAAALARRYFSGQGR
jgi:hypothetical protein